MKSIRTRLAVGSLYKLKDREGYVLECIRNLPADGYSDFNALVRSTLTGWTMHIHGINMYEDGTIDWDFSTHGIFTDRHVNPEGGVYLVQVR